MNSSDLRKGFLEFFRGYGHTIRPSSSLIPDDPSLLFTVAGMVPFKPMFLGQVKLEYTRAASCQKCIRTNDIENVGRTHRHHTFFEMLGNFSFGDYFKAEAIPWAWEYLTSKKWLGLPPEKLLISVYKDDQEAIAIWGKSGVPASRITKLGEDSNFWTMGPTGPCGPCSEIYYDFGPAADPKVKEGDLEGGGDRYVEIWNNVFTQFDRQADGSLAPLPKKNIDTGMGLERLAAVMQGVTSNFDTDLFQPLIQAASQIAGVQYGADRAKDVSLKVIAEHLRAAAFLVTDGVLPSNEGRGYVLRRIFRRAVRHGRLLGIKRLFMHELIPVVLDVMGPGYPDLLTRKEIVASTLRAEEERFARTLDSGLGILKELIPKAMSRGVFSGAEAFKLYDTYGFPLELTQELAQEQGLSVDRREFEAQMEAQRERARAAWTGGEKEESALFGGLAGQFGRTRFTGYQAAEDNGKVLAIFSNGGRVPKAVAEAQVEVILDTTPFYGESGGQVGDTGVLEGPGVMLEVVDTVKRAGGDLWVHRCRLAQGEISEGTVLTARVDARRRAAIARHHSATHLLHAALREVLGPQAQQAGSLVTPDRLRFDFSNAQGLTPAQLETVERRANEWVLANLPGQTRVMAQAEARAEGAMALFGEKYGDEVRVVSFGSISKELCGGVHLKASGETGLIKILSESSVSSGVRRLEAVAGLAAYEQVKHEEAALKSLAEKLKTSVADLLPKVEKLLEKEKDMIKQIEKLKTQGSGLSADEMARGAVEIKGVKLVALGLPEADAGTLKAWGDQVRDRLKSGVILLGAPFEDKVSLVAMVTPDLISKVSAGKLVAELAPILGGRGGGKPEMAQAGGKDPSKLAEAIAKAGDVISKMLG